MISVNSAITLCASAGSLTCCARDLSTVSSRAAFRMSI